MVIKNLKIYGEDKKFTEGDLSFTDGIFTAADENDNEIIDGKGLMAIPGLVDVHFHGCVGDDFCDAKKDAIKNMAKYEASIGVTSICPATMTLSEKELMDIMTVAGEYEYEGGAKLVGINMEGPYISSKKKGAQAGTNIRPCSVSEFKTLQEASGNLIKIVDIAPEEDGAMEFIDEMKDDVVISIAHTTADFDIADEAIRRGVSHITHLYNAMPPFTHRAPGVIGAARDHEKVHPELICDGIHIHPSVVRATFEMFGADRMILISDSMRATGLTDGKYTLGGQDVYVKGRLATLEDGTIAGSATNLMDCMKTAVNKMGIKLEDAIACASMNPAKEIGIFDKCGSIKEGKCADFVLLDEELNVKAVYVDGVHVDCSVDAH